MKIKVKDYCYDGKEISIKVTNNGKTSTKIFYYRPTQFVDQHETFDAKSNSKTPIYDFLNMLLEDSGQKDALKISKEQTNAKEDAEAAREQRLNVIVKEFKTRQKQELKDRMAKGLCNAVIYHGPGHQSKTFCECKGPHKKHKCTVGRYEEYIEWTGMKGYSGY